MTASEAPARTGAGEDDEERRRLTALEGLAALSLDALSSVAYGPQAILIVLVAAGAAGLRYALPVTIAIVVLLTVLVISYRQVIAAFPSGGGAYAVAKRHLGTGASLTAAASLMWTIVPTVLFIIAIAVVIITGLLRSHPAVAPAHRLPSVAETVGMLLILKAFASGCSRRGPRAGDPARDRERGRLPYPLPPHHLVGQLARCRARPRVHPVTPHRCSPREVPCVLVMCFALRARK
jgi:hypothetical protein